MKKGIKNPIIKFIIAVLLIMVVSNIIFPKKVNSFAIGEEVDTFINSILQFLMFLADLILGIVQNIMVGTDSIEDFTEKSAILYSPGMIFLDKVPGLKVNFVGASEDDSLEISVSPLTLKEEEDVKEILQEVSEKNFSKQNLLTIKQGVYDIYDIDGDENREINDKLQSLIYQMDEWSAKDLSKYNCRWELLPFLYYKDWSADDVFFQIKLPNSFSAGSKVWVFLHEDNKFWELSSLEETMINVGTYTYQQYEKRTCFEIPTDAGNELDNDVEDLLNVFFRRS